MPIVDGKYEVKIGTTYATVEDGLAEVKRMIQKSRRIRISNIPMTLLEELKPMLKDKDLMIILPMNEKPTEELKQLAPTATTKARITLTTEEKKQTRAQSTSQIARSTS